MNTHILIRHARILLRSELLAAQARLSHVLRKGSFAACALLFLGIGVVFLNIGLYAWLLPYWGAVWTPIGLGLLNFALAALATVLALVVRPGPELALAEEMRSLSTQEIETELRSAPLLGAFAGGDRSQALQLLLPALTAILGSFLKRRKSQG